MSMFTRNDKTSDASGRQPPQDKVQDAAPQADAKRPQQPAAQPGPRATAQPYTGVSSPQGTSLISRALKITGQLESSEDIQIEGEIEGDVHAASVKVGSGAKVKGTVYGEAVEVAGSIEGKIEARKVVLTSSAHVAGDVVHADITIQSGAYINGHCKPEFGKSEGNVQPFKAGAHEPAKV